MLPPRSEARATVLPPDLFERFERLTFWTDPAGTSAWRIAADQPAPKVAER